MAEPHQDPALVNLLKQVAPYMPGVAGAVLSLAWGEKLSPRQKLFGIGIGFVMAVWVGPAFLVLIGLRWPDLAKSSQVVLATGLLFGLFGMTLASAAQRLITAARIKFQMGPIEIGSRHGMDDGASS